MKSIIANNEITAKTVRLVLDGSSEVMAISKARELADNAGLDLILINTGDVPVVKIADLNKYKYELKQAEKASQKKQRQTAIATKEIQFTYETQEHDLDVKLKSALKFLSEGKQVHLVMKTSGRGLSPTMVKNNTDVMENFVNRLGDVVFVQKIEFQGKKVTCTVKVK
ncbi:translation initiation factor IF-3 [Escherichia coli]|nr:translation initiation factor IF-3 [Escherichia coli]USL83740.1 translation initiation factor IF3 [Escherichia phage A4]